MYLFQDAHPSQGVIKFGIAWRKKVVVDEEAEFSEVFFIWSSTSCEADEMREEYEIQVFKPSLTKGYSEEISKLKESFIGQAVNTFEAC